MSRFSRSILSVGIAFAFMPLALSAQDEEKKAPEEKRSFKRRDDTSSDDLRKQLQLVPEVGFDQVAASLLLKMIRTPAVPPPDIGPRFYAQLAQQLRRPELVALPWRKGVDSQLGKEAAEGLHVYSVNLRTSMRQSVRPNDIRPDADKLRGLLTDGSEKSLAWNKVDCVPTVAQMLQTENTPLRMLMIDMLAKVEGKPASVILAQRAIFDLAPEVREKAVEALATRSSKDFQQVLLDGLRWPWRPAADHAAEAIAALRIKEIVPQMVVMLKEPDPRLPYTKEGNIREMVRINHLTNCLLCHAPSQSREDLVRGRIPVPGVEMPPLYYGEASGDFVRADTTFLRQDFSLVQPVANPGKWSGQQRFDYLLRTRKATPNELQLLQGASYPQREALLFALREVTGTDLGSRSESWLPLLNPVQKQPPSPGEKK